MGYFCNECKADISPGVFIHSTKNNGRALCISCQGKEKQKVQAAVKVDHKEKRVTQEVKIGRGKLVIHKGREPTAQQRKLGAAIAKWGFLVELEKWDGHKHIDIAIVESKVNIEVDGEYHFEKKQALADLKRTFYSFKKGYFTLRIPNQLVDSDKHLEETAEYITQFLNESNKQLEEDNDY